ncbi:MAG: glutathione S-transferase N-terminal domain-containing protein [Actinomycetia bacterium]|nr:glutathione S-transferase N-terminal domain-containing protein [Actinomycetes bacterium]
MNNVLIYSTNTCPYCKQAKDYIKSKGVDYQEIDVSSSRKKLEEMIEKSGQMGVPVIDIGGKVVVGFDKKEIDRLLGENK